MMSKEHFFHSHSQMGPRLDFSQKLQNLFGFPASKKVAPSKDYANPPASSINIEASRIPSKLLQLPNELLVDEIFSWLDVKDICRLKQVCHQFNTLCTVHRQRLPNIHAETVLIRCGHWKNVLRKRHCCCKKNGKNPLLAIDFFLPSREFSKQRRNALTYGQLLDNFKFEVAVIDVQVLNKDILEGLNLPAIAANHLLINFRYGRADWPVRHCSKLLIEQLSENKSIRELLFLFPDNNSNNEGQKKSVARKGCKLF